MLSLDKSAQFIGKMENVMTSDLNKDLPYAKDAQGNETLLSPRTTWRKPCITRIELKRTMQGGGSIFDGQAPSLGDLN